MMSEPPPSYKDSIGQQPPPQGYGMPYGAVPTPGMGYPNRYPNPPYPPHQQPYPPPAGYPNAPPQYSNYNTLPPQHHQGYGAIPGSYPQQGGGVQPLPTQSVVLVGGCPACRVGVLEDDFTCLGVLLAIICFPIGILCCLAMRQRRCVHCGSVFG